jgi:methenyltetrahydrofolate cyclohydrolase
MLTKLTVEEFVNEVASFSPAPGGGSVAALAGAQGAGLLSMYCSLSQNRDKLGDVVDLLQKAGEEARFLAARLLENIDEDTIAFNQVMEAYRLPKADDREKEERRAAIQETGKNAAEVPLQTARGCLRVLSLVSEVAAKGNPSAITDLGVANLQAFSGLVGGCYNVQINLGMLTDKRTVEELKHETENILKEGQKLFEGNRALIEKAI